MAVSEKDRRSLYDRLAGAIGGSDAEVLMSLLPREPASELVTRSDTHANTTMLRGEMAELRSELKGEMSELRSELKGEMSELRSELKGEMSELRTDLRGEMAGLRVELKGELNDRFGELIVGQARLIDEMGALRVDLAKWLITSWLSTVAVMIALTAIVWGITG